MDCEFHSELCCKHMLESRGLQIVGSTVGGADGIFVGWKDG